jgi:hypothetical protein
MMGFTLASKPAASTGGVRGAEAGAADNLGKNTKVIHDRNSAVLV